MLLVSLAGSVVTPRACGPDGGLGPVIALEVVRSSADVSRLFGAPECAAVLAKALRQGTVVDQWLFIPAFVAFLSLGALAFSERGTRIGWAGVASAVLGGVCDEGEDQILLGILNDLPGHGASFDALFWFVRIKFVLLSLAAACIGWLVFRSALGRERVLGVLMLVGGAVCSVGTLDAWLHRLLIPGTFVAWLSLLITVALRVWRPQRGPEDHDRSG